MTFAPANPSLAFTVKGHPEPAGSKRIGRAGGAQGRPIILDANRKSEPWKRVVAATARGAMLKARLSTPFDGPLWVEMVFFRERPASHLRTNGELSLEGQRHPFPAGKPDVLKLARGVEDAMSGVVYTDDARIVSEQLRKQWGPEEGVQVTILWL